jgi:hypothetical protein
VGPRGEPRARRLQRERRTSCAASVREAFVVSLLPDGRVRFEIVAFSRTSDAQVRQAGPVGRGLQRHATSWYRRTLKRFVDRERQEGE